MELWGDQKGQSEVIGAVLVFAIVVGLLALNQTFLVPQHNQEIEFKLHETVQQDMEAVRSGFVAASASNKPQSIPVTLGTNYPARYLAINPAPPGGTLRTVEGGVIDSDDNELSVSSVCGTGSDPADTKFLKYTPSYNYYDSGLPITFENSVVYRQDGTSGPVFNSGQILIQGNQITIVRTVGDIQASSSKTTSVDIIPSKTGSTHVSEDLNGDGDLSLTIPTDLSASDWADLLEDQPRFQGASNAGSGRVTITVQNPSSSGPGYTVRCTSVGVNEEPDVSPPSGGSDDEGLPPALINPVGPNQVAFNSATIESGTSSTCPGLGTGDCKVNISFTNHRSSTVDVVGARFLFYSSSNQGAGDEDRSPTFDPPEYARYQGTAFEITGPEEAISGDVFAAGETKNLTVFFRQNDPDGTGYQVKPGDWTVLRITYEDQTSGEKFVSRYFIPPQ